MASTSLGQLATFGLCVIGFVLCTLGCAGNSWIVGDVNRDGITYTLGLWKICATNSYSIECESVSTGGLFKLLY